jgi:CheY-like chemotaxis protein
MEKKTFKLLIIEDLKILLEIYRFRFSKRGFEVLAVNCGKEGIVLAQTKKPDLILLEINLKDISPLEIIKILKEDQKTKDIPILILGNPLFEKEILKSLELGATAYINTLEKTPKEIEKKVREILG